MNILTCIFPYKCPICGDVLSGKQDMICEDCYHVLPKIKEPVCLQCGKPIRDKKDEFCFDCSRKKKKGHLSYIEKGSALWVYDNTMKKAMADFKYGGCTRDALFFAKEIVKYKRADIKVWNPDCIIPVPIHWKKLWFRGYNQASAIANAVGESLDIPVWEDALLRVRYTKPQNGLDDQKRKKNLLSSMEINKEYQSDIRGKNILLIDDIYTTGATLEACAKPLVEAGAKKVYSMCMCIGSDY